jgi:predicted Zn-dependent protease
MDEEVPSDALLLGFQLLLMSLVDPAGISTFIFDVYLNKFREYIRAGYSRLHEQEADELGMQIAGQACFNIGSGVNVFKKLADLDGRTSTNWADTHPASIERYQKLSVASEQFRENDGYMTECGKMKEAAALSGFFQYLGYK